MKSIKIVLTVFVFVFVAERTQSKEMVPEFPGVPVTKLIQNAEKLIVERPDDYYLHYLAGRLYSIDYATDTQSLGAQKYSYYEGKIWKTSKFLVPWLRWDSGPNPHDTVPLSKKIVRRIYLKKAIQAYEKAVALNPEHGFSFLGLAWCMEEDKQSDKAIDAYRRAFDILYEITTNGGYCMGCENVAAEEAGRALLRLLKNKKNLKKERKKIEEKLNDVQKAHRGWISPIIFPVEPVNENDFLQQVSLLKNQPFISFDISGLGVKHSVRWLPKNWAFLVWDPQNTKEITSGKQLFGSVTWWIFWNNGYEPLSLLDDNQDGWLKEKELEGIAVWMDENHDGVSQPPEVQPLSACKITAINTHHDGSVEGMVFSKAGLLLSDGTVLPTLDWMPEVRDEMLPSLSLLK